MTDDLDYGVDDAPDDDDRVEQIADEDSLIARGADTMDEGYTAPDNWSPLERFGDTAAEMRQGETLDMRVAQEEPDVSADADEEPDEDDAEREVGDRRAGRLVLTNAVYPGDDEADDIACDMGVSGGAASAEEAAMHVIDDEDADA